jgi:FkbM family methyltransferase
MNIFQRILIKIGKIKVLNKIFDLDTLKKRQIKTGFLKRLFFYGKYYDHRYFDGFFEERIIETINKIMVPGNIYDIGAHFGFYSLIFAKSVKDGKVYCFEPNPYCFERLSKTIELNNFKDKVELLNFAVGSENTEKEMMILLDNLARSTLSAEFKEYYDQQKKYSFQKKTVPIKSLDSLNLPVPVLIKIDVEGFESDVIRGMRGVLKNFLPNLIIEIHESRKGGHQNENEIIKILSDLKYVCLRIENNKIVKEGDIFLGGHILASVNKNIILLAQENS